MMLPAEMLTAVVSMFVILHMVTLCDGQRNQKYCAVCRALVTEAEWLISQVDPRKSIQVGSFRVDPQGNQKIKDKQYARSEVHIEEMLESICDKMTMYAELTFDDGNTQMVRTVGLNGERLETTIFKLDREKGSSFKYQCLNLLENDEEKIISLMQRQNVPDYEKLICGEGLEVCTLAQLAPLFTLPEARDDEVQINDRDDKTEDAEKENEDINAERNEVNESGSEDLDEREEL